MNKKNRFFLLLLLRLTIFSIVLLIITGTLITYFIYTVKNGKFGPLPSYEELKQVKNHVASEVYSSDGKLLGKYYLVNRTDAKWEEISPNIINALVATEDIRFFNHQGIDKRSLIRVLVKSILLQNESAGGGSTISQQLAKNLFPRKHYPFLSITINKIKEAITAHRLEKVYSKNEILTLYLNTVSFGENVYGIEAASERYFSTTPKTIKINEAAVLIGMLKATTSYNPRTQPEKALQRRNVVINQMIKYDYLDNAIGDSLKQEPLNLQYNYVTHNDGLAPYFRETLRLEVQKWLDKNPKKDGTTYNLYTDGLKIHTTINAKMQEYAETAVKKYIKVLQKNFFKHWKARNKSYRFEEALVRAKYRSSLYKDLKNENISEDKIDRIFQTPVKMKIFSWNGEIEKEMSPIDSIRYYLQFLNAGLFAMEPQTGKVLAWVGGINYKYFKYDHIRSKRQVGSIFKPIVYAAAIEKGLNPCDYISNERETYTVENTSWSPGNANDDYGGFYSMQGALSKSLNTVTAKIMMETGIGPVINLARRMGISSDLPEVPSLALGTAAISLEEMVSAYSVFPNRGYRTKPVYIERIEDGTGKIIKDFSSGFPRKSKAMEEETADILTHFLKCAVDSGTAISLRSKYGFNNELAGKTGTTQNQVDGWFMGFTPDLVTGVWVGHDDPSVHFRISELGQGSKMALPIWAIFMKSLYKDPVFKYKKNRKFNPLAEGTLIKLDCESYTEVDPNRNKLLDLFFGKKKEKSEQKEKPKKNKPQPPRKKTLRERLKKFF